MKAQDVLPVIISIIVIILVAVFQRQSKLVAAITATMPLTAPLALWIVYASTDGNREETAEFSVGMLLGVVPTLAFLVAVWLAARAGVKLVPMIVIGYATWAIGLVLLIGAKRLFGL